MQGAVDVSEFQLFIYKNYRMMRGSTQNAIFNHKVQDKNTQLFKSYILSTFVPNNIFC